MNISESILSALSGITSNKMRSILTMVGIIVGISSVMMISSLGEGYKKSMNKQFEDIGLDKMTLQAYSEDKSIIIYDWDLLTREDVERLRKYDDLSYVTASSSMYTAGGVETFDDGEPLGIQFVGIDEYYHNVEKLKLKEGRYLIEQDMENDSKVVIIDEDLARSVFGRTNVLGEKFHISSWFTNSYTIVGILESTSQTQMYLMYGMAQVYIPYTTMNSTIYEQTSVDSIMMKVKDKDDIARVGKNVVRLTEFKHENKDKYTVSTASEQLESTNSLIGVFTLFLGFVAGISLLVGGIGVMNIMLVSVTERTKEIGIRKSLGATNSNIKVQFLIEAIILTSIGGLIGMVFGYVGGLGLSFAATMLLGDPITPYIAPTTIAVVVIFSVTIGITFGVYPAAKAAKLDPVESLRFEN